MVPAMAPDVSWTQFQLLLQFFTKFLRRRLQQVFLFGELHQRTKQNMASGKVNLASSDIAQIAYLHENESKEEALLTNISVIRTHR